ncbi:MULTISPECIES: DUF3667 domain-containing protein [unclassified Flagellimonas]|uniref:DUF3667 domain-containing protein n=1 Tax=Flagellimonas sp. MMG031 TaxID=3158549 RepID=A0AAU7MXI9_9FLAO
MTCKNCDARLRTDYLYCPACGAKVIRNRITIKNLWTDFLERYFNLDNTFIRTVVHLTTTPEVVIEGYLQGIRRKYLNPISYMGIAITLSGLIVFLMVKSGDAMNFDMLNNNVSTRYQEKLMDFILDYQALIFLLFVPMMTIAGWLCFDQKRYNFAERTIIFMYALAHYSLVIFLPSIIVLFFIPEQYFIFSFIGILFMVVYTTYVIIRISKSRGVKLIVRLLLFYFILLILYFAFSIALPLFLLLIGELKVEDFLPPQES